MPRSIYNEEIWIGYSDNWTNIGVLIHTLSLKLLFQGFHCTETKEKGEQKKKVSQRIKNFNSKLNKERQKEERVYTLPYLPVGSTSTNSEQSGSRCKRPFILQM